MDRINNLPLAVKIGIPVLLAVLIAGALLMFTGGSSMSPVARSTDNNQIKAWQWKLDNAGIKFETVRNPESGQYEINVPTGDHSKAKLAIEGPTSQIGDKRPSAAKCKEPSGMTGTADQRLDYQACTTARSIGESLEQIDGILAANVSLSMERNQALGADTEMLSKVTATIYPDPNDTNRLDGKSLASQIANRAKGATLDTVIVLDNKGQNLWNTALNGSAGGGSATVMGISGAASCNTKLDEDASLNEWQLVLAACDEYRLVQKLSPIVGGDDRLQVSVNVTLNPTSETQAVRSTTKGSVVESTISKNSFGGESSSNTQQTSSPGARETVRTTEAGYRKQTNVSITLDSRYVSAQTEKVVRSAVRAAGYPEAEVFATRFATKSAVEDAPAAKVGDAQAPGNGGGSDAGPQPESDVTTDEPATVATGSSIPSGAIAAAAVLLIALAATIVVLWMRSSKLSAERKRFEQEFRNEQQLFQDFARSNPDDLASDIASLFGTPQAGSGSTGREPAGVA